VSNQTLTTSSPRFSSNATLKACIFATGLAGIVAEYVMATIASYLLGDSVVQWTLTISIMLFAMGVGSRLSKYVHKNLLDAFIIIELILSLLCAISATSTYIVSANVDWVAPYIYLMSFAIGTLIGLEIPIATRLNDVFEDLHINISSVMEKDYYGALLGGLIFAFVALPYLGLTYTPIILGGVNFLVAAVLYWQNRPILKYGKKLLVACITLPMFLIALGVGAEPIIMYGEQKKYIDQVIFQQQTPYQRIVITRHKQDVWLYLNGNQQFSSYDEERYHEPLVHPAMLTSVAKERVLVLGGGDGLAVREVLKYDDVKEIVLVDLDPAVTKLGLEYPQFIDLNEGSLKDPRVTIFNKDAYVYLQEDSGMFDIVIIDLPDPKTVGLARLYTREFYRLVQRRTTPGGVVVTQATSPFFSSEAFLAILKTMRAADFSAVAYHTHIPTLGQWGWVLGMKTPAQDHEALKERIESQDFDKLDTRYLNSDAMVGMLRFGKGVMEKLDQIKPSDELDLSVYHYYKNGSWEFY